MKTVQALRDIVFAERPDHQLVWRDERAGRTVVLTRHSHCDCCNRWAVLRYLSDVPTSSHEDGPREVLLSAMHLVSGWPQPLPDIDDPTRTAFITRGYAPVSTMITLLERVQIPVVLLREIVSIISSTEPQVH